MQEYLPTADLKNNLQTETAFDANLESINNDCMLEILNHLECIDLGSIADVSELKKAAQMVFASKWKGMVTLKHDDKQKARDFLHNLGPQIKSICLVPSDEHKPNQMHDKSVFHLISQYCCGTLRDLAIRCWSYLHETKEISPSLFSGLQKLTLEDCVISIEMLTICEKLTELALLRVEEIDGDAQNLHLKLNKLKTLKIELHPKIRCRNRHCNMNATHLDYLGYEMHHDVRVYHLHDLDFINEADSLEDLEVDAVPQDFITPIIKSILKFKNIKTLKIYCEYIEDHLDMLDILGKLEHLTEFVWGYPKKFNANHLLYVIKNARNLEKLIVNLSNRHLVHNWHAAHQLDAKSYGQMLDIVSQRSNGKPLDVIIVGHRYESKLKQFEVAAPMNTLLTITCLKSENIGPILNIDVNSSHSRIKMSNEQIKVLRDRGMFSNPFRI